MGMVDTKKEHDRLHQAVKDFAKAIGCEISEAGGKEFARVTLAAIAVAAFERHDIFDRIARKLLDFRPKRP